MLERLYEDATSFGFPEERFERVYREVELTLYRDAVRARVIAPLTRRLDGRRAGGARRWPFARARRLRCEASARRRDSSLLCVLERDVPADDPIPTEEAARALRRGGDGDAAVGARWRGARDTRAGARPITARWQPVAIGAGGDRARRRAGCCTPATSSPSASSSRAIDAARAGRAVAWALDRFEMGCERATRRRRRCPTICSRCARCSTPPPRPGEPASACGLPRCAPRRTRGATSRSASRRPWRSSASPMGGDGRVRTDGESPCELVARGGGPPARAAARRPLRLPRRRPEGRGRRHPDRVPRRAAGRDRGPRPAPRTRAEPRFERQPEPTALRAAARRRAGRRSSPSSSTTTRTNRLRGPPPRRTTRPRSREPDTAEMEPVTVAAAAGPAPARRSDESADWGWDDPEDFSAPV